jgi:hypothetical protein
MTFGRYDNENKKYDVNMREIYSYLINLAGKYCCKSYSSDILAIIDDIDKFLETAPEKFNDKLFFFGFRKTGVNTIFADYNIEMYDAVWCLKAFLKDGYIIFELAKIFESSDYKQFFSLRNKLMANTSNPNEPNIYVMARVNKKDFHHCKIRDVSLDENGDIAIEIALSTNK